jgi:hypothetical protein
MKLLMHLFVVSFSVLVLIGVIPVAMAWFERYTDTCLPSAVKPIVPDGCFTLAAVMGAAAYNIGGATLGSGLSIPLKKSINDFKPLSDERCDALAKQYTQLNC